MSGCGLKIKFSGSIFSRLPPASSSSGKSQYSLYQCINSIANHCPELQSDFYFFEHKKRCFFFFQSCAVLFRGAGIPPPIFESFAHVYALPDLGTWEKGVGSAILFPHPVRSRNKKEIPFPPLLRCFPFPSSCHANLSILLLTERSRSVSEEEEEEEALGKV